MIRRNIIANAIGRAWGVISVYLFIPLYLKFLGVEAYGLVGFYATLLAILAFADMGLTATLNREMARLSVRRNSVGGQSDLLRTYETIYAGVSVLLALSTWLAAPLIANHWLQSNALNPREIETVIRLMGVSIALQLPAHLYIGGLIGLERQVLTNSIQIGWGILRGVGAVLVLWIISPTIFAFACWQLFSNIIYCFSARAALWRVVSRAGAKPRIRLLALRNTWRYAAGMAGMAFLSTLLVQADKLAVSKMLPLETFGYYMVAIALASVPRMLASPIGVAVFPKLTRLVAAGDADKLIELYRKACTLAAVAVIPAGLTLAFFATNFIFAWTGNAAAAQHGGMVASLLLIGETIQALSVIPFYLVLAHGDLRIVLVVGVSSVVLITPLLILLIMEYGLLGAGISWVIMNVTTVPPYMYFVHRQFMRGELRRWSVRFIGLPALVSVACVALGRLLAPETDSRILTFAIIGIVWMVTTAATVTLASDRAVARTVWKSFGAYHGAK